MSPRRRSGGAGLLVGLAVVVRLGGVGSAEESERGAASGAGFTGVDVVVVGKPGDLRWARGLLGTARPAAPTIRWRHVESFDPRDLLATPAQPGLLACWVDLSDDQRGRLYFAAPSGQHFLIRDVELSGQRTEVDRAALAEVLELSMAALLENERLGLTRAETETLLAERATARGAAVREPSPPATPVAVVAGAGPPTTNPRRWQVGARFAEQILSPDFPLAERVGLEAAVGRQSGAVWLAAGLGAEYQFPCTARGPDVGVELQTLAVQGGITAGFERSGGAAVRYGWQSLSGGLGGGVDFDRVAPRPGVVAESVRLASPHWSPALVLRPAVGSAWTLGARLVLEVQVYADVRPIAVHYDLETAGGTHAVFTPWRVRPGLALVLALR